MLSISRDLGIVLTVVVTLMIRMLLMIMIVVFGMLLMFMVVIFRMLVVIMFIVFMERAQRRLLIQYPKRQVGNRMFQGDSSHLPLKLNTAGVIPPIFASSLLLLPATVAGFSNTENMPAWAAI